MDKRVSQLIFEVSEVAKLRKEERMAYEATLKAKWDTQNAFDSVKRETTAQIVRNLLLNTNFSVESVKSVRIWTKRRNKYRPDEKV
ncbi:hypothetical protein [Parapedobacter sp. DT-150]|uniref:hypothetical protein n=1 Tax=Parapedobacter sp. DT-150 TaxID=3396162 RepID=UPI003F19E50D